MQEHVQVDSTKCKACRRCEFACIASHHGIDIKTAMKMKDTYTPRCWAVKGDSFKTSVRCHCCNPAPCCNICPTGALEQNADGSFSIHPELCAGCMMCVSVCPYGVISPEMVAQNSVVDTLSQSDKTAIAVRCDLCHDWRIEKGVAYTACMEACAARALVLVKADGTLVEAPKIEKKAPAKAAVAPKSVAASEAVKTVEKAPEPAEKKTAPVQEVAKEAEKPIEEAKPEVAAKKEAASEEAKAEKSVEEVAAKQETKAEKPAEEAKPEVAAKKEAVSEEAKAEKPVEEVAAKQETKAEKPAEESKPEVAAKKEAVSEEAKAEKPVKRESPLPKAGSDYFERKGKKAKKKK